MLRKTAYSLLIVGAVGASLPAAFAANDSHQPYGGLESRTIKALSGGRVDGLLTGKGIGYALAAELNHYPGPRHAIDFSQELSLSPEQDKKVRALFQSMEAKAIRLGKEIVDGERELDRAFSEKTITTETLEKMTGAIAVLEGKLRAVHLSTHLEMVTILSPTQVAHYDRLRGYDNGEGGAMMKHQPGRQVKH